MQIKDSEKYLGVNLGLNSSNDLITDDRYYKLSTCFACIPFLICFAIKKRIFEGAIIARTRYSCMMFSLKNKLEKCQIVRFIWKVFKREFYKLSYLQLIMFIFNLFRFFFDLKDLKELKEKYDASNDKKVLFNKVIKDKLYTDIDQWDHFVDSSEFDDSIIDDISVNNLGLRKFANNIWSQFKQNAVREWQIMKKEEAKI